MIKQPQCILQDFETLWIVLLQGQESIGKILEKLKDEGSTVTENLETFSRVSIRRLGRLLPDARWVSWL